jgi:hypothetical protein
MQSVSNSQSKACRKIQCISSQGKPRGQLESCRTHAISHRQANFVPLPSCPLRAADRVSGDLPPALCLCRSTSHACTTRQLRADASPDRRRVAVRALWAERETSAGGSQHKLADQRAAGHIANAVLPRTSTKAGHPCAHARRMCRPPSSGTFARLPPCLSVLSA